MALQFQKYVLPSRGLVRPRKLFLLELLPEEECLSYGQVFSRADYFPVQSFLWITNRRIVVLQYRWVKMPILFEIPRTCITSLDWHSSNQSGWIDVNYQNPGGQERIQLRSWRKRSSSRKEIISRNQTLLSQLHQIFHGHQKRHGYKSYPISEAPSRVDGFSKAMMVLGLIACLCLFPYFAFQYPDKTQELRFYNSSAGCSLSAAVEHGASFSSPCEGNNEKIVRLYSRSSRRSSTYWIVLENGISQSDKVQLGTGEEFYKAARVGDMVEVQRFNGKIVKLMDGPVSTITPDHPQWQVSNVKWGLWGSGVFALFSLFTILVLRRNLCW